MQPVLHGKGASDYERYLRTDELLSLQKSAEEFRHKDEMTFHFLYSTIKLVIVTEWSLEAEAVLNVLG